MNTAIKTVKLANNIIAKIYQDEILESPREWDNLGTMVCFHRNYNLGDYKDHGFYNAQEFLEFMHENKKNGYFLPLYLYDHSGLAMSTSRDYPFNCPWDSGQVGYIYVLKHAVRKEWNVKRISKKLMKIVIDNLIGEVKTYNQYLQGNVYLFQLSCDICGEEFDSCGGFYGSDEKESGMTEYWSGAECPNCKQAEQNVERALSF